jgi:hypothetical protein
MDVKQMKKAHASATVCHNWKIESSAIKRPGHLQLEFWESGSRAAATTKASGAVAVSATPTASARPPAVPVTSFSRNFSQTFQQGRRDIVRFFVFDNQYHFMTSDGSVFCCPFATRYQPGNGKINPHTQLLRKDVDEIVRNSKIINMRG